MRGLFLLCDLDLRHMLAMALHFTETGLVVVLEDDLLLVAHLADDLGTDAGSRNIRSADLNLLSIHRQENFVERSREARFPFDLFDLELVARGNAILLPSRFDYCEFGHNSDSWR